jgi:uncharacterized membrane protein
LRRQQQIAQAGGTPVLIHQEQAYSGPLPAPQQIEEYNRIVPGSGEILFEEFRAQSRHRRSMEKIIVVSDAARSFVGMFIGGGLAVYMTWLGAQLIREGHATTGFSSIGIAIATAVGPFLIRSYLQSKERQAQQLALTPPKHR